MLAPSSSLIFALQAVCDHFQDVWVPSIPSLSPLCYQRDPLTPGVNSYTFRVNFTFAVRVLEGAVLQYQLLLWQLKLLQILPTTFSYAVQLALDPLLQNPKSQTQITLGTLCQSLHVRRLFLAAVVV